MRINKVESMNYSSVGLCTLSTFLQLRDDENTKDVVGALPESYGFSVDRAPKDATILCHPKR